jgi:hypothetical protein
VDKNAGETKPKRKAKSRPKKPASLVASEKLLLPQSPILDRQIIVNGPIGERAQQDQIMTHDSQPIQALSESKIIQATDKVADPAAQGAVDDEMSGEVTAKPGEPIEDPVPETNLTKDVQTTPEVKPETGEPIEDPVPETNLTKESQTTPEQSRGGDKNVALSSPPDDPAEKTSASPAPEADKTAPEISDSDGLKAQEDISNRQYFVPIRDSVQKRSIKVSIVLTLLVILLGLMLIDLMLDSGTILLLQKIPHTHFFTNNIYPTSIRLY